MSFRKLSQQHSHLAPKILTIGQNCSPLFIIPYWQNLRVKGYKTWTCCGPQSIWAWHSGSSPAVVPCPFLKTSLPFHSGEWVWALALRDDPCPLSTQSRGCCSAWPLTATSHSVTCGPIPSYDQRLQLHREARTILKAPGSSLVSSPTLTLWCIHGGSDVDNKIHEGCSTF